MAYNPNVPNEANLVRGATGDLEAMQENFELLSGVAVKGISGLIGVSANSPTSGQGLRWNGTVWVPSGVASDLDGLTDVTITSPASGQGLLYDGAGWVNSGITIPTALDNLTDVTVPTPASGEVLTYNGTAWVNASPTSISPRSTLGLSGSAYTVTGVSFSERVPLASVLTSGGGFTFNTTSGQVIVGSGVTAVNILAQAGWVAPLEPAAMYVTKIFKNGSGLEEDAGYKVAAEQAMRGTASGGVWLNQAQAINVPCVSGDMFTLVVTTDDQTGIRELSGQRTFLMVEDARKSAGGGGATVTDPVTVWDPKFPPLAANAHAMNDEFSAASGAGPGGLAAKWVEWDPAGVVLPTLITGSQMMNLAFTMSGGVWGGVVQAISGVGATVSGTNWAAYARIHLTMDRQSATSSATFGMVLFENVVASGTTSNFCGVLIKLTGSGTTEVYEIGEYADYTDVAPGNVNSQVFTHSGDKPFTELWLRIRHQGSVNRLDGDVSSDGIGWRQLGTRTLTWAPVEIGLIGANAVENATGTRMKCSLFRMASGVSARTDMIPAGRLTLGRVGDNVGEAGL